MPDSRLGPGDHHCSPGQADIATLRARDRHDVVIVQEKLDGSNVAVAKVGGLLLPLTRAGYHANTSPYAQHHRFAAWVHARWQQFDALLGEGERVCGEWLAQAHGTRYNLGFRLPFVAFDIMRDQERASFSECSARCEAVDLPLPPLLSMGEPLSVERALSILGEGGFYGAIDAVEGAVWRVERGGKIDFLVKYVRPEKKDGAYLESITGEPPIWNWDARL